MSSQSKFLSYVLRHKPEEIGLSLDTGGWANIAELLKRMDEAGQSLNRSELEQLVASSDKKRFTLSPDGQRIRAAQGHSIAVDLGLTPQTPPDILYHGTATRFLDAIQSEGLRPMDRQQVHLSDTMETAIAVGRRHGAPAILIVDSAAMAEAGRSFFRAENGVWLTEKVPARFLSQLQI